MLMLNLLPSSMSSILLICLDFANQHVLIINLLFGYVGVC